MPGSRTVQFVVAMDSSQYERGISQIEQAGGRLVQTQQKMDSSVKGSTQVLKNHGAAGRESFLVIGQAMDATGAKVGPLATAFYRVDMIMDAMSGKASRTARALIGAGIAGAALGGVIVSESAKEQSALAGLQNAVETTGHSWDDYKDSLERTAAAQAHFGTTKDAALGALETLTRASQDPAKAQRDLAEAQDLAASSHVPLSEAAKEIAAVYGGSTRVLRQYGINVKDIVDPQKELTKATKDQASAQANLEAATQHLSDVRARVQAAEQQSQEQYQSKLQAAEQAQQTADQRVTDSTQRLADARLNLADVEARVHEATTLSIQDVRNLRDAHQSLTDVEAHIASGELTGQAAYEAKRDAMQKVSDVEEDQRKKQQVTIAQQHELRAAHEAVTKAITEQARARAKDAEAHAKTHAVRAAGPAGIPLGLRQEEAAAERSYRRAQARVATASREMAKAKRDLAAFPSQVQHVLNVLDQRIHGSAERQANTIRGMFARWKAEAENWFGSLGAGTGTAITAVSTGVIAASSLADLGVGRMIKGALRKIGLLKPAMIAADAEVVTAATATDATIVAESEAAGAASSLALGPIALAIGLVVVAAYELYKHWHAVWNAIKTAFEWVWKEIKKHFLEIILFFTGGLGIYELYKHWHKVWGWIKKIVSVAWDGIKSVTNSSIHFFEKLPGRIWSAVKDVGKLFLTPFEWAFNKIAWLWNNTAGRISFHLPSWIPGIGGKGFSFPKIPTFDLGGGAPAAKNVVASSSSQVGTGGGSIRAMATGGIVPGQPGQPVPIIAHGGEEVTPFWNVRAKGGDGGAIGELHVHVHLEHAAITDKQTAQRFANMIGDGVHNYLIRKKRDGNPSLGLA